MTTSEGFLVVMKYPEDLLPGNPRYRGLDRLPPYPSDEETEQEALDAYVFGDYKNDEGLIPSLVLAEDLLNWFAESSRVFEIIYVRIYEGESSFQLSYELRFLGFDVAGYTPFWSIVGDFPPDSDFKVFADLLNEYGLFESVEDARAYLETYRSQLLRDQDTVLMIWGVYLVE